MKTYANADGYIDVQALTYQLANTYQEDADYLTVWYSGRYNGLAKKHMMKVDRARGLEHQIIVYCKANQDKKVIHAIDVVFGWRCSMTRRARSALRPWRKAWSSASRVSIGCCYKGERLRRPDAEVFLPTYDLVRKA